MLSQLPQWNRESNIPTDNNIGPSVQAQPTNLSSVEPNKSSSSGNGQADVFKAPSPTKPISSSQTSNQSGTVSGCSGSPACSAPQSSSSSGTSSSSSGYPPSSSHTSSSSDDPPPSVNQGGTPRSEGADSQQPPPMGNVSNGSSRERKDESRAHPSKEDMDTTSSSQIELQGSSQTDGIRAEGTQDSFLGRKNESGSFSSRDGAESGYSAGSSSSSVLVSATCSVNLSTASSLSAPLATVSDSQETVENSVSCVEDSVPLSSDTVKIVSNFPHTSGAPESITPEATTHQAISRLDESEEMGNTDLLKLKEDNGGCESEKSNHSFIGTSSERHVLVNSQEDMGEQQINKDVSSELLPLENPQSPELLNDGPEQTESDNEDMMDAPNSPEIAIQAPKLSQNRSLFQAVCSTEIKESHTSAQTVTDIETSNAKSPVSSQVLIEDANESSQAMETDMISTQSSFVLQLADSQCSVAPVSPMKTDAEQLSDAGEEGGSLKSDGVVIANPEEIEEYEKEFPSLVRVEQHEEATKKDDSQPDGPEAAVNVINVSKLDDNSNAKKPSECTPKPTSSLSVAPITSNGGSDLDGPKVQLDAPKPVPLYESLECDVSVGEALSNPVSRAQLRGESQQSVNNSQGTSSGEWYQYSS